MYQLIKFYSNDFGNNRSLHLHFPYPQRHFICDGLRSCYGEGAQPSPRTARAIWSEKFARFKQVKQLDQTVIGDGSMLKFSTFAGAPSILWCGSKYKPSRKPRFSSPDMEIEMGKYVSRNRTTVNTVSPAQQLATSSLRAQKTFISCPPARNGIAVPVGWWDGSENMFN